MMLRADVTRLNKSSTMQPSALAVLLARQRTNDFFKRAHLNLTIYQGALETTVVCVCVCVTEIN